MSPPWHELHEQSQLAFDSLLRLPQPAGFALLGLALAVTIPGRHGQRPLNGALLGGGIAALLFLGLRGVLHDWIPGIAAVLCGALAALFGIVAPGWGTAAVMAGLCGLIGGSAAHAFGVPWWAGTAPAAGLGLFAGLANHLRLSLLLPPFFAALFATLGAAIAWAPHERGAHLVWLGEVEWAAGAAAVLFVLLLALSVERAHRKKLRLAARQKRMEDEELKKKLASQKAAWERLQKVAEDE